MNTYDARLEMRNLAHEGLDIVRAIVDSNIITLDQRAELRRMSLAARSTLTDAGYPGEAAWRGLQRAAIGVDTGVGDVDPSFWRSVQTELEDAIASLDSLLGANLERESDMRIIG